jgi:hypothetical protein
LLFKRGKSLFVEVGVVLWQDLLEVKENEISVPRVLNAAERAAAAAAAATEAARLAAAAADNPQQRGVLDMMAGRLEDSAAEDVWIDPALPPMYAGGFFSLLTCVCFLLALIPRCIVTVWPHLWPPRFHRTNGKMMPVPLTRRIKKSWLSSRYFLSMFSHAA